LPSTLIQEGEIIARKTKLNDEMLDNVKDCIELGMSYKATAGAIRVSDTTFLNWLQWGKTGQKDPIYTQLYSTVREAESKLMYNCLFKLRKSAETGNIESVKWLLERRFQEFGKQSNLNVKAQTESVNIHVTPELQKSENDRIRAGILAKLAPRSPSLIDQEDL
jgi:hypothetical protein